MTPVKLKYHNSINFGDYISKVIIEKITQAEVIRVEQDYCEEDHIMCTGSILECVNDKSIVFGTGSAYYNYSVKAAKKYLSVRGKLSYDNIVKNNMECFTFGDPVLLLPDLFPKKTKSNDYKLGIIPHYIEYYNAMTLFRDMDDVIVIDLLKKPETVIDEVNRCDKTVSSSLHGLILSHAYNIPSVWIKFTDKVLGDGFKFHDYFSSVNINQYDGKFISNRSDLDEVYRNIPDYCGEFNLDKLRECCKYLEQINGK